MQTMTEAETQNEPSDEALLNAIAGGAVWAIDSPLPTLQSHPLLAGLPHGCGSSSR